MNFQYPKFGWEPSRDRLRFRRDRFESAISRSALADDLPVRSTEPATLPIAGTVAPFSRNSGRGPGHTTRRDVPALTIELGRDIAILRYGETAVHAGAECSVTSQVLIHAASTRRPLCSICAQEALIGHSGPILT
jgi:hypothetical protein